MTDIAIFGAKSIALGVCRAIQEVYKQCTIKAFLVSDLSKNSQMLAGIHVLECSCFAEKEIPVLIATPENIHSGIVKMLEDQGYKNIICIDSVKEATLMEQYYEQIGCYPSVHQLRAEEVQDARKMFVAQAKFYKDVALKKTYSLPEWVIPVQVGTALTEERVADICDNTGENISGKNVNYCELTALYWLWKNELTKAEEGYYGLFHYRRILDIQEDDVKRMYTNDVDVVLPFPMMCEPDIREHHSRYLREIDWNAMLQALREQQPEYADAYEKIFRQPYMYNYNMLVAKREVLQAYCDWLFPILERTEELSSPRGWERKDRYIGYLGENLLTLYFMYHQKDLKIYHTGRRMLT